MTEGRGSRQAVPVAAGSAEATDARGRTLSVHAVRFAPGREIPRHVHERACVTLHLEGGFEERIGGSRHDLTPAQLLAKPALEPHADRISGKGSFQVIVEPSPGWEHYERLRPLFDDVVRERDQAVFLIGRQLAAEAGAPTDVGTELATEGLFLELLAHLWRFGARERLRPRWLKRVEERIRASRTTPSLGALAADAGVHPSHLAATFRAFHGETIGEFSRRQRIGRAARRLLETDDGIATVAQEEGFFDQSHFTRTFKRVMSMTPAAYRVLRGRH